MKLMNLILNSKQRLFFAALTSFFLSAELKKCPITNKATLKGSLESVLKINFYPR